MAKKRYRFITCSLLLAMIVAGCKPSATLPIPVDHMASATVQVTTDASGVAAIATPAAKPAVALRSLDQDLVAQLAAIVKMRGHLMASIALWNAKLYDDAFKHTNEHIVDELFYVVRTPLKSKNADLELQDKLAVYSKSANKNSNAATIDKNHKAALLALDASYAVLAGDKLNDMRTNAAAVRDVIDVISTEYDASVINDQIDNAEEWQDSMGFLIAAMDVMSTSVEPVLKNTAPDKYQPISAQFSLLRNNFPSYFKFPNKVMTSEQFTKQVDDLIQTLSVAADLPPMMRTMKILMTMQRNVTQAATQYRNGAPDLAYEFVIKCQLEGIDKIKDDIGKRDRVLMNAFEAQMSVLRESIKTRAPANKVDADANALTDYFDKAIKIVSGGARPGSKH